MPAKKQKNTTVKKPHPHSKNTASKSRKRAVTQPSTVRERIESDSSYFLKLVLVAILGTLWLKFSVPLSIVSVPLYAIPVGLMIGVILVKYFEVHPDDRKIWYAVLLVITLASYFLPLGIIV